MTVTDTVVVEWPGRGGTPRLPCSRCRRWWRCRWRSPGDRHRRPGRLVERDGEHGGGGAAVTFHHAPTSLITRRQRRRSGVDVDSEPRRSPMTTSPARWSRRISAVTARGAGDPGPTLSSGTGAQRPRCARDPSPARRRRARRCSPPVSVTRPVVQAGRRSAASVDHMAGLGDGACAAAASSEVIAAAGPCPRLGLHRYSRREAPFRYGPQFPVGVGVEEETDVVTPSTKVSRPWLGWRAVPPGMIGTQWCSRDYRSGACQ